MAIIYSNQKCKNPKRKPGWQKEQAEHDAWLKSIQSMSSGIAKPKSIVAVKPQHSPPKPLAGEADGVHPARASKYVPGVGGKSVLRPELLYRDDPEMLARELAARARKFNVAPAYNKGGLMLMTDEMMVDLKKGLLRRR